MTAGARARRWSLVLYVNGAGPRSLQAVTSVKAVCDSHLAGEVDLRIVDVNREPDGVTRDGVMAVPTLVRRAPGAIRRISGDFSNLAWLRGELGLDAVVAPATDPRAGK